MNKVYKYVADVLELKQSAIGEGVLDQNTKLVNIINKEASSDLDNMKALFKIIKKDKKTDQDIKVYNSFFDNVDEYRENVEITINEIIKDMVSDNMVKAVFGYFKIDVNDIIKIDDIDDRIRELETIRTMLINTK